MLVDGCWPIEGLGLKLRLKLTKPLLTELSLQSRPQSTARLKNRPT